MATNKQLLRLLTVGGVQREVVSLPGTPVTLTGWGGRLAVVYQMAPCESSSDSLLVHVNLYDCTPPTSHCSSHSPPLPPPHPLTHTGTENVFRLMVWVLDVRRRKQLHSPHTLPLSHKTKLEWIGSVVYITIVQYM